MSTTSQKQRSGKRDNASKAPKSKSNRGRRRNEDQDAVRLRSKLVSVLKRLPEVERNVLEARMGLLDGEPMKPGQVASLMEMSIPEVKRIEARAVERIREVFPLKGLERFLD